MINTLDLFVQYTDVVVDLMRSEKRIDLIHLLGKECLPRELLFLVNNVMNKFIHNGFVKLWDFFIKALQTKTDYPLFFCIIKLKLL